MKVCLEWNALALKFYLRLYNQIILSYREISLCIFAMFIKLVWELYARDKETFEAWKSL